MLSSQRWQSLLALKAEYKAATGEDWKPPAAPAKAAPAKAPPAKASTPPKVEGPALSGEAKELDAKVTAAGEKVRALKTAKAEKAEVDEAVKVLLALKADFKAAAGFDWKPAGAGEPKKEKGKGKEEKENKQPKEAPADGEKSETQKKRDPKKLRRAAKKAAHKSEEAA